MTQQIAFVDDPQISAQLRTGTDYLGAYGFLRALGFGLVSVTQSLRHGCKRS